jgi:hypothetical protein
MRQGWKIVDVLRAGVLAIEKYDLTPEALDKERRTQ